MNILKYALAIVFCFTIYSQAFALVISEIHFDPDGSDTNREWVEVYNNGSAAVDFSVYKFFEANVNHSIAAQSEKIVQPGEYAIVVQDFAAFAVDYPGSTAKLFKSSFSLSNSGEALSFKNAAGSVVDSYTYNPTLSASGAGLSEQKLDGVWGKGLPTPGSVNVLQSGSQNTSTTTATTTSSTTTVTTGTTTENVYTPTYYTKSSWPTSEKVYLKAGDNKIGITGKEMKFVPRLLNGDKQDIFHGAYLWSFGDGYSQEGRETLHVYKYPGEYTVTLEVTIDKSTVEDSYFVQIINPEILVGFTENGKDSYTEITNNSKEILNLGDLVVTQEDFPKKVFTLPRNFTVLPKRSIKLPNELTGFATTTTSISIAFKNGATITTYTTPVATSSLAASPATASSVSVMTLDDFKKLYPDGVIAKQQDGASGIIVDTKNKSVSTTTLYKTLNLNGKKNRSG